MPGMSGLELQAELASQGRDIPVIFITAFPEDRLRRQARAGGAIDFLAKPFDGSTIIRCIETAVGPSSKRPGCPRLQRRRFAPGESRAGAFHHISRQTRNTPWRDRGGEDG